MAESQGGASNADPKKKDPSLAEDFGKDFLSSWKSAKMGNDAPAPSNKKKSFNFDNDDFELGADFGKLSSFKMDMHDFDFSSPIKKTEKPKEKPCKEFVHGKQELKDDKFSFTFDFNGLDRFDLDSNLLMGEKKSSKCTDANTPDYSNKNDKKEESRRNSVMSVDVSEDAEIKKLPTSECTSVSKSEDLIVSNILHGGGPSTSYSGHDEVPSKAIQYITDKIDILEENKNGIHNSEGHKQHPSGIHFLKQHDDKVTQELPLQSVSDDSSAQEAPFQLQTRLASLNPEKANSAKELEDSMKPVHCSLSTNSSPVYSCNSRSWSGTSITELPNISGEYQKHQGNINEATGANEVLSESTEDRNDTEAASATVLSQKVSRELKYLDEKLISGTKFLPSPLHGGSIVPKSMSVKDKANAAIQLKPLSKLTDNVSQQASALTTKILYPVDCGKIKPIKMHPANVNRQTKQNDVLKAEKLKVGISKSYDKGLTKSVLVNTGSQKNKIIDTPRQPQQNDGLKEQKQVGILKSYDQGLIGSSSVTTGRERIDDVDTSRLQLHSSKLPGKSPSSIIAKGVISNPVSGSEFMKSSKKFSIERQDLSLEDDKICDISSLEISGTTKLNINTPNSTMPKEAKSARVSGRNLEFQNTASSVCRSNSTEKYSLSSPSLKRKTLEESKADPEASNPFKRVMETATERSKPPKVSPKDDWKVVAEVENLKTTSGSPEIGSIADFEVPILIENDGNVEKAEACSKELGNICNMLKKKHEEAKELLVRAMVTNNELLMLNHPVFAEKICALQKFAISLQSKQF